MLALTLTLVLGATTASEADDAPDVVALADALADVEPVVLCALCPPGSTGFPHASPSSAVNATTPTPAVNTRLLLRLVCFIGAAYRSHRGRCKATGIHS